MALALALILSLGQAADIDLLSSLKYSLGVMSRKFILLSEAVILLVLAVGLIYSLAPQHGAEEGDLFGMQSSVQDYEGELKVHLPSKTFPGFTLLPLSGSEKVYLLNQDGEVVHSWHFDADRARLLPNGNLLVVHGSKWGMRHEPWKSMRPTIREYDWNGEIVWEYTASDIVHHDIARLENGNTLFPVRVVIPGTYKGIIQDEAKKNLSIRSDKIIEVDSEGKTVWEWNAHDHLDLNSCGKRQCKNYAGKVAAQQKLADWSHINTSSVIPLNKWYESGDKRFKPGNIITLPRNWWTTFIIDRDTKEVVWEYTGDYKGGLSGGHEAHMIPRGLPGEGNILIFDNGRKIHQEESFILEINPVTMKTEWVYDAGKKFFSNSAGSAQRLPNGNTFISEDVEGRVFEVTKNGEIVWEYLTEHRASRAKKYDLDYCPQFSELQ